MTFKLLSDEEIIKDKPVIIIEVSADLPVVAEIEAFIQADTSPLV